MKYSVIIPYRNREKHLELLLPRLMEKFKDKDYEIFVAEQDDSEKFRISSLYDIAYKYTNGDVIVFHDVDYYPTDDVVYELSESGNPTYPVRRVVFIDMNFKEKDMIDVPHGYRKFKTDVGDHWGGVFMLSRKHFEIINGFNPLYVGWGKEEEDTHCRLLYYGLTPIRNTNGLFLALPHKDGSPLSTDEDFLNNCAVVEKHNKFFGLGYKSVEADVIEYKPDGLENVRWLKIKNFIIPELESM